MCNNKKNNNNTTITKYRDDYEAVFLVLFSYEANYYFFELFPTRLRTRTCRMSLIIGVLLTLVHFFTCLLRKKTTVSQYIEIFKLFMIIFVYNITTP